jgi:predicted DNA-binding protein
MYDSSDALVGLLIRLPATDYRRLKRLSSQTRIRQSEYLREAIADLLRKYDHHP